MDVRATALHPSALLFCAVAGLRYGSEMPLARERKRAGGERERERESCGGGRYDGSIICHYVALGRGRQSERGRKEGRKEGRKCAAGKIRE